EGAQTGGKYDPTGLSDEAVLAHENDLEGCLIVAQKEGDSVEAAHVVYVETLAHNRFIKYVPENATGKSAQQINLKRGHARLFVEPKGHGIQALTETKEQLAKSTQGTLVYKFGGQAEDPE